jgi:hypothetical protein
LFSVFLFELLSFFCFFCFFQCFVCLICRSLCVRKKDTLYPSTKY